REDEPDALVDLASNLLRVAAHRLPHRRGERRPAYRLSGRPAPLGDIAHLLHSTASGPRNIPAIRPRPRIARRRSPRRPFRRFEGCPLPGFRHTICAPAVIPTALPGCAGRLRKSCAIPTSLV